MFPFARFLGVDPVLGPEMKSTGEVMGLDRDYAMAFAKSQLGAGTVLPMTGKVFVSLRDSDKDDMLGAMRDLVEMGFSILATRGTKRHLEAHGIPCEHVNKVLEGRPHIVDLMKNGEVHLVFNTTEGAKALADSQDIRRTALMNRIPYYTTLAGALAATRGHPSPEGRQSAGGPLAKLSRRAPAMGREPYPTAVRCRLHDAAHGYRLHGWRSCSPVRRPGSLRVTQILSDTAAASHT